MRLVDVAKHLDLSHDWTICVFSSVRQWGSTAGRRTRKPRISSTSDLPDTWSRRARRASGILVDGSLILLHYREDIPKGCAISKSLLHPWWMLLTGACYIRGGCYS